MKYLYILISFLVAFNSFAATYYVDMANGSDSNNGTSDASPWKHCPGQATSPARTINSGDTILFKRGEVHYLDAGIQMIAGVTYDTYGSGARPILDGQHSITYAFSDGAAKRNGITIRNIDIRHIGGWAEDNPILDGVLIASIDTATDIVTTATDHGFTVGRSLQATRDEWPSSIISGNRSTSAVYYVIEAPTPTTLKLSSTSGGASVDFVTVPSGELRLFIPVSDTPGGTAIGLSGASDNILIENVGISKIGQWIPKAPTNGVNSINGNGISMENNNGVTIRNVTIEKLRTAISIKATASGGPIENILVENCTIDHFVWGVDMAPRSAGATLQNVTIRGVTLSGTAVYDAGNWQGFGEKPHTDGMFFRTAGMSSTWTNVLVDGCKFYEDFTLNSAGGQQTFISVKDQAFVFRIVFF